MTIIRPQSRHDLPAIEALLDTCFGVDRRARTSYRLRDGADCVDGLSFVARHNGVLIGTIRFWSIAIGTDRGANGPIPGLLLGPLAVDPSARGSGLGLKLIARGLTAARRAGHGLALLIGDEPYYARAGFRRVAPAQLALPGPCDPDRLLWRSLDGVAALPARGWVRPSGHLSSTLNGLPDATRPRPGRPAATAAAPAAAAASA